MRGSRFVVTQSTAKRFGASSCSVPSPSIACSGRTQVLYWASGMSAASAAAHRVQRGESTAYLRGV